MNTPQPQIPPIPTAPVSDGRGNISPEWWRWFHLVFTTAASQQGQITNLGTTVQEITYLTGSPAGFAVPDPISDPAQGVIEALARAAPASPVVSEILAALRALVPAERTDGDQIAMRSLMLMVPR